MVKQPVPISPARTQLPGTRVSLIVHSVHTSGRQDPGRLETNYVPKKSLCMLPTSSLRPGDQSPKDRKGQSLWGSDTAWHELQALASNTIALGFQGLGQQFSTGIERGLCTKRGNFILENEKEPGLYIIKHKKGLGFV